MLPIVGDGGGLKRYLCRDPFTIYKAHLAAVVVDGEVAPRVGVSGDLAVNGRADLLGAEDALLSLLDLLHDLGVVAQLSAPLPEHLVIKDKGNKTNRKTTEIRRTGRDRHSTGETGLGRDCNGTMRDALGAILLRLSTAWGGETQHVSALLTLSERL